ncbi:hypothetical protein I5907_17270 [Panacibacter sp. DH6]|uniref:GLPGLI family protein n=1 Tax=Panacibacter microcysteis TaxID=2793269 RepID=A0A931MCS1_9BACT|nr:hypothetical protein [Panacibacter microcysteis]MBG9377993.1 hypothetical protein [Panacibacter microcysteis]
MPLFKTVSCLIAAITFMNFSSAIQAQQLDIPIHYVLVDSVSGDLDKDSKRELAVIYNMDDSDSAESEGVSRVLIVYQNNNNTWQPWQKSFQAILGSRDGGMMGDPYEEMMIEKGILMISQGGGSSWKWNYTDKYRYQNGAFYLIGYSSNAGKPCEYWLNVDFNVVTGLMIVTKEYEECDANNEDKAPEIYKKEHETLYRKGFKITLQARNKNDIVVKTPVYKHEIYLARKRE